MTTRTIATKQAFLCNFCGKNNDELEQLIAGPNDIHICNECVDLCMEIIQEQRAKKSIEALQESFRTATGMVAEIDDTDEDGEKRLVIPYAELMAAPANGINFPFQWTEVADAMNSVAVLWLDEKDHQWYFWIFPKISQLTIRAKHPTVRLKTYASEKVFVLFKDTAFSKFYVQPEYLHGFAIDDPEDLPKNFPTCLMKEPT
jgi:hypothetical protein